MQPSKKLSGIAISEIRQMNARAKESTLNLGIGQLPYNTPTAVTEAGKEAFDSGDTRYTANMGMFALRDAIAKSHTVRIDKATSAHQVIITNGAEGAVWNVMYSFLDQGDEILIPEIGFSIYDTIAKMQGATVITYKLTHDFQIDFDDVRSKITPATKLFITNNPNNPTGAVYNKNQCKEIAQVLDANSGLYCLSDEIYKDLYLDGEEVFSPSQFSDKVIVVDGISKRGSATGLRIGWTIATASLTEPMIIANQYITTCASSISQKAALPIVQDRCSDFEKMVRKELSENRDIAFDMLSSINGVSVVRPSGAFYIFPNISAFGNSKEVASMLLEKVDVLTIPGIAFGARGDAHIRISFAVDQKVLIKGLTAIKKQLESIALNSKRK